MKRELIVGGVILALGLIAVFVIVSSPESTSPATTDLNSLIDNKQAVPFVEIQNPSGFVNTDNKSIKIADYVGKQVILLDIMTYSCINCQRTFPYVKGWYEKYKDDGLIVIGIHTPEFAFEKDKANVEAAMREFGINFPIVLDNDYSTWNALGNHYWPRKYLIDIHGNIVYDHIGEGAYEETEMKIQELLEERAAVLGDKVKVGGDLVVSEITETKTAARSPETYFGSSRNEFLGNGVVGRNGNQTYLLPKVYSLNRLYLGGDWTLTPEAAVSVSNASVLYRYNSKEVYLVASAPFGANIEVWQDGEKVDEAGGVDVTNGVMEIGKSRLYKVIQNEEAGEHVLELKINGAGAELYAFTFG